MPLEDSFLPGKKKGEAVLLGAPTIKARRVSIDLGRDGRGSPSFFIQDRNFTADRLVALGCVILSRGSMTPQQEQEHAALVDAAADAERRNYAIGMAAAFKTLTSAQKPTPAEIAEQAAAETEWQRARTALANYEARRLQ
jgi:hypothetical protein